MSEEVRHRRGDAWASYFRVELLATEEPVLAAAREAITKIRSLKEVESLDLIDAAGEDARAAIHTFIRVARDRLILGDRPQTING